MGCPSWPCWLWSTTTGFRRQEGGAADLTCRGPEHPIDTQLQDQAEDVLDGVVGGVGAADAGRGAQHPVEQAQIQDQGEHAAGGPGCRRGMPQLALLAIKILKPP